MTMAIARSAASVGTLAAAQGRAFRIGRAAAAAVEAGAVAVVVGTALTSAAKGGRRVLSERLLMAVRRAGRAMGMVARSHPAGMELVMVGHTRAERTSPRRGRFVGRIAGPGADRAVASVRKVVAARQA